MKIVHGMRPEEHEAPIPEVQDFKICPICGATCFSDMEVCFGCLHHFEEDESPISDQTPLDAGAQQEMHHCESMMKPKEVARSREAQNASTFDEEQGAERAHQTLPASFDHLRDIPGLKKPETRRSCASHVHCKNAHEDAMTSHHICSDGEGRQFEISISVKLL